MSSLFVSCFNVHFRDTRDLGTYLNDFTGKTSYSLQERTSASQLD